MVSATRNILNEKNVGHSKYEPLVDEVELVEVNLHYANAKFPDGRGTTVSIKLYHQFSDLSY